MVVKINYIIYNNFNLPQTKTNTKQMLKGFKNLEFIKDQTKMTNAKSKRRRNLVKKAIELSSLCDLETILVVRDAKNRRVTIYESAPEEFSIDDAKVLLDRIKFQIGSEGTRWTRLSYTNENYMNIKEEPVSEQHFYSPTVE